MASFSGAQRLFHTVFKRKSLRQRGVWRVVVMGPPNTGKSALIRRLVTGHFIDSDEGDASHVMQVYRKNFRSGDTLKTFDIVDTSGTDQLPAMRMLEISRADAFVLVFDHGDMESFNAAAKIRDEILDVKPDAPIVFVANKCECRTNERINIVTADLLSSVEWGHGYIAASAKNNTNVKEIFEEMIKQVGRMATARLGE